MGSRSHPQRFLVLKAIHRLIDNAARNGGVLPAAEEARRLSRTYPLSELSEAQIRAAFGRLAAERGILTDLDTAKPDGARGNRAGSSPS
jgi:hypothetical protein